MWQSNCTSTPLNVSFQRTLTRVNLLHWQQIVLKVMQTNRTNSPNSFVWALYQNGNFSVNSMYRAIITRQALPFTVQVWNIKVSLKIKVFLWYLYKGVTLTKDNLARKNWNGNVKCSFCNLSESIQHLFFNCPLAKFVWRIIAVAFNIISPRNFRHIFSHLLGGTD